MIHYDFNFIWNKMLHMFRKSKLEYRGPYLLRIVQKAMASPEKEYESRPILWVESDDKQYEGMLFVTMKEYEKARVGQYFGRGGVIVYTKRENCYYMSKYDSAKKAISTEVIYARLSMMVLFIVIGIFVTSLFQIVMPLFR